MPSHLRQIRTTASRAHYGLFLLVAGAALLFQALYSMYVLDVYRHPTQRTRAPFEYTTARIINRVNEEARTAGARPGDELFSINGTEFKGERLLHYALLQAGPGGLMRATVRHPDGSTASVTIRIAPYGRAASSAQDWTFAVIALLFVPALALCLGVMLVFGRPWDLRAWLTLALMMSFSQIYYVPGWDGPLRTLALGYRVLASTLFSVWLVLFSIYFPERTAWDRKRPWIKWLFVAPVSCIAILAAALSNR